MKAEINIPSRDLNGESVGQRKHTQWVNGIVDILLSVSDEVYEVRKVRITHSGREYIATVSAEIVSKKKGWEHFLKLALENIEYETGRDISGLWKVV